MKIRFFKNYLRFILIDFTGVLPLAAIPFIGLVPHFNNVAVYTVNSKALKTVISVSAYYDVDPAAAKR